ncbi:CDP-alcohol phosphatidyltransferase family protein [Actinokineospora guangxiensis]|uniref:CDP-alcohol phosphatidyltransferase family protein n=1 Tax=Actinokineospora guangxiensis TaxID=1490288 RepID=A0ABW0EYI2_9PSEU
MTTVAHPRAAESAAWLAAQLALLAGLTAALGLGPLGWAVGTGCAAATLVLLGRAVRPAGRIGPADRVTLGRALLVGCVAALVFERADAVVVLTAVAAVALALDFVDGQVARRTGTASAVGARFDMEVDAFLILVLSAHAALGVGPWVLLIGLMRYLFVAAAWVAPWLRAPLPPSWARKAVAAGQGVALVVAVAVPAGWLLAGALAALVWSFGRDVRWLWARRGGAGG